MAQLINLWAPVLITIACVGGVLFGDWAWKRDNKE